MKRLWPCGHRGQGKFCHRCVQEEDERLQLEAELAADDAVSNPDAPVESFLGVRGLPVEVRTRALQIIDSIAAGLHWSKLGGKFREGGRRKILSVPVGYRYRLVFRLEEGILQPVACISHEKYNHIKAKRIA